MGKEHQIFELFGEDVPEIQKKKKKRKHASEKPHRRSEEEEEIPIKSKEKKKKEENRDGNGDAIEIENIVENGIEKGRNGKENTKNKEKKSDMRVSVCGDGCDEVKYKALESFDEAGLPANVIDCCKSFEKPSPIQAHAWPFLLHGKFF